jgi:hypothetical protein
MVAQLLYMKLYSVELCSSDVQVMWISTMSLSFEFNFFSLD